MGLWDELQQKAEASVDSVKNDIYSYFKSRVTTAVVKVGEPARGNQTAEQLARGEFGGQSGVPASNQPASLLMNAGSGVSPKSNLAAMLPMVLVAAAAGALLFGKRARG